MFGLHAFPSMGIVALVIAGVVLVYAASMFRRDRKGAAGLGGMVVTIATGAVITMNANENYYEIRDTLIELKLAPAGISMVGLEDWDSRAIVKLGGCTASYQIVSVEELSSPHSWPLVPSTGEVREGCTGVVLDQLFAPAR